ncbi:MAG: flagellar export protein FliJ [Polyangiales bacterium]
MDGKKLKRMLDLKKRIERAKKGELAIARDDFERAHDALGAAEREQHERVAALASEREVSLTELSERARFAELAGSAVKKAKTVVHQRERAMNERQEDVVVATRDVKTFENLNDKAKEAQRQVQNRAEQSAADDQNSARWSQKR